MRADAADVACRPTSGRFVKHFDCVSNISTPGRMRLAMSQQTTSAPEGSAEEGIRCFGLPGALIVAPGADCGVFLARIPHFRLI